MDKVDKNWVFAVSANAKAKDRQTNLAGVKFTRNQRKFGFFTQHAVDV